MFKPLKLPGGAWNKFWFRREPAYTLGIFRIVFGLFILGTVLMSFPNWERFYGPEGSLPLSAFLEQGGGFSWSLFALTDQEWFIWFIFWFAVGAAAAFTAGLKTRTATIALFVIFISMFHRNTELINGQDQVAAMLLFFSMFAPMGERFSIDELWRRWRHFRVSSKPFMPDLTPIWSVRLMQVSIALLYLFSGPAKFLDDVTWRDGSAIYYVTLSDRWFRFPGVDFFHNEILSMALTFGTLFIEIAFPLLVWFSRTRPFVLAGMAFFHLSLMVFMAPSVFYFNLMMLISLILFVRPEIIERLLNKLPRKAATVFYDGQCGFCTGTMHLLRALDGRNRLALLNFRDVSALKEFPDLNLQDLEKEMYVRTESGDMRRGFFAYKHLSKVLPSLYLTAPLFTFPGAAFFGPKIYGFIAKHRFKIFPCQTCGLSHTADVCEVEPPAPIHKKKSE